MTSPRKRKDGRKKNASIKATPASAKNSFNPKSLREPDKIIDDATGKTRLIDAILQQNVGLQEALLKKGANPDKASKEGKTPLHYAARLGDVGAILRLLEAKAHINARDKSLETPLFDALHAPQADIIVRLLLTKGCNPDIPNTTGETPLAHAAALKSHPDTLRHILRACQNPERPDNTGMTPFLVACKEGTLETVKTFIFERVGIFIANQAGNTALHLAAARTDLPQKESIAEFLLSGEGAFLVNALNQNRQTPIYQAIKTGDIPLVKKMIAAGATLNKTDSYGNTPLHEAIAAKDLKIATLLIESGTVVSRKDDPEQQISPLMLAIRNEDKDMVTLLLDNDANINATDRQGSTPLMEALWKNDIALINLLLDRGAAVTALNKQGQGPLHYLKGHVPIPVVDRLIAAGAKVGAKDVYGRTPLHNAIQSSGYGPTELVQCLLRHGADPTVEDKTQITPYDLAIMHSKHAIIEVFKKDLLKKGKIYKSNRTQTPPWGGMF